MGTEKERGGNGDWKLKMGYRERQGFEEGLIYRARLDGLEFRRRKQSLENGEGFEGRWDWKAKGEERAFKLFYSLFLRESSSTLSSQHRIND
jgi:hypothetical protein